MEQVFFNIEDFEEEGGGAVDMTDFLSKKEEERNWAVLADGISFPGLTKEEARAKVKELGLEGKKAVATIIGSSSAPSGKVKVGRPRVLSVDLCIRDESGLPLGVKGKKLIAQRWSNGWTVKSENQPGEKGTGETRRQAVIDWFYKNQS